MRDEPDRLQRELGFDLIGLPAPMRIVTNAYKTWRAENAKKPRTHRIARTIIHRHGHQNAGRHHDGADLTADGADCSGQGSACLACPSRDHERLRRPPFRGRPRRRLTAAPPNSAQPSPTSLPDTAPAMPPLPQCTASVSARVIAASQYAPPQMPKATPTQSIQPPDTTPPSAAVPE